MLARAAAPAPFLVPRWSFYDHGGTKNVLSDLGPGFLVRVWSFYDHGGTKNTVTPECGEAGGEGHLRNG